MKRLSTIAVLLAMTMLSLAAAYTVPGASFTISVAADGVATVQEDLVVDFDAPSHGIIREVPLNGASVDLVHCSEDCVVYEQGGVVCFQIGDADELVSGPVQYQLVYTFDPGIDRNQGYDEFYQDIITATGFDVDNLYFSIAFIDEVDQDMAWVTKGPYGSTTEIPFLLVDGRSVAGKTSLADGETLTVRVELPDGYFIRADHSGIVQVMALLLCLLLVLAFVLLHHRFGRDEDPVIPVVVKAPDGLSPLDVGYLYDSSDDQKDYLSMLFFWADKGLVSIKEEGDGFTLERKGVLPADAPDCDKALFDAFFMEGDVVELKDVRIQDAIASRVRPALSKRFSGDRGLWDKTSLRVRGICALAVVLFCIGMPFMLVVGDMSYGLFAAFVFLFQAAFVSLAAWSLNRKVPTVKQCITHYALILFISILALIMVGGVDAAAGQVGHVLSSLTSFVAVASLSVLCCLAQAMPRRSAYAQDVIGRILGYRDFLENVEIEKLKALVDEDPAFFYHNLAYAMVLGLEKEWAGRFSSIAFTQAAWYQGDRPVNDWLFYSAMFHRFDHHYHVHCIPHQVQNASYGRSGSYSGFSGFSGGGAGGGGMRSW